MLADDDPVTQLFTTTLLQKAGYEVTTVPDGLAALEALRANFHSVLLTDWEMPKLDGLGLVKAVRDGNWPGYVYTILLTGRDSRESILAGLEAGADDYLTKPVDEAELLARMKTGWRVADLERRLQAAQQAAITDSLTDMLTGVHNLRYLMQTLPAEVARAKRFGHPLAVVMTDIDHFKKVNDTFGHLAGDLALCAFANVLSSTVREGIDSVVRCGGEEFLVICPETDLVGGIVLAEKLRVATEALTVQHDGRSILLTASFGVASGPEGWAGNPDADALLAQADGYLDESKARGRNRVSASGVAS